MTWWIPFERCDDCHELIDMRYDIDINQLYGSSQKLVFSSSWCQIDHIIWIYKCCAYIRTHKNTVMPSGWHRIFFF